MRSTLIKQQKRKYAKIPKKNKIIFLKKVIEYQQPLKHVADLLKINYSTAKTILRKYRADTMSLDLSECQNFIIQYFPNNQVDLKRCSFRSLSPQKQPFKNDKNIKQKYKYEKSAIENDKKFIIQSQVLQSAQKSQKNIIKIISKVQFI